MDIKFDVTPWLFQRYEQTFTTEVIDKDSEKHPMINFNNSVVKIIVFLGCFIIINEWENSQFEGNTIVSWNIVKEPVLFKIEFYQKLNWKN